MIGKTISHYKILEKLGEGGMGVVYKAEDTKLKRTVALKFLPPELTRDEDSKKRFVHEAQAASTLDHSNICTIYEVEETDDGQTFIAMAFYEGETLKERIGRGPLKVEEAVDIAIQVAEGLKEAHEKDIVHRDVKSGRSDEVDQNRDNPGNSSLYVAGADQGGFGGPPVGYLVSGCDAVRDVDGATAV